MTSIHQTKCLKKKKKNSRCTIEMFGNALCEKNAWLLHHIANGISAAASELSTECIAK